MSQYKQIRLSMAFIASTFSSLSYSAGFAIMEQSVTGLGHAFSGSAAVAEDASTIFFNPAGLTYLSHSELAAGIHLILPKSDFNNNGSTIPGALGGGALSGREGDAGNLAAVPNFYYAHRVNDDVVVGVGVNAPFGLVTEYSDNWVGRYHAIKSDMLTVNINPTIAFKATDRLSLGFGANLQYVELELSQAVDIGSICAAAAIGACAAPQSNDGKAEITADDWSWGFNLGLIYQATDTTRLALAYRSKISHHVTGKGKFTLPANSQPSAAALGFTDGAVSGDADLPETVSFALHHQINNKWAVMADATWTRWERFQELAINSPDPNSNLNSVREENWDNSMRYGLGFVYTHNDKWTFRGGAAYDETPTSDEFREARLPDQDRKWIALGASYKYSENLTVDAGYSHIFLSDPKLDDSLNLPFDHRLVGDYEASIDILSVQMRWVFL